MSSYTDSSSRHYVCWVLGSLLLLLGIGELIARLFIVPIPNTTPHRVNTIYTENKKNIAVGDSHIYYGFISSDYFLNLGQNGTTIPMMKIIVEQYFKYRNPGKVVIEAAPQLFSQFHFNTDTQNYELYFNQNYPFPIKAYIFEPGIGRWLKKIKSLEDFGRILKEREKAESYLTKKGRWKNKSFDERTRLVRSRIANQTPYIDEAQEFIAKYNEMIEFLIERGADVCIVRTPVDETYLTNIEDNAPFSESIEVFKRISVKTGVHFVDFQELDYQFTLDKFLNQDHITAEASVEFSKLVNKYCFEK